MTERGEIDSWNNLRGRSGVIHRHDATARCASAKIGFVVLIESNIPEHDRLGPIACGMDDQSRLLLQQIAFLPVTARAFRHPDFFFWKSIVQFILRGRDAAVTVGGRPRGKRRGFRIA